MICYSDGNPNMALENVCEDDNAFNAMVQNHMMRSGEVIVNLEISTPLCHLLIAWCMGRF